MKITIYELLGLVKEGKAPKKIKYNDYIYTAKGNAIEGFVDYCSEEDEWCFNHYVRYENLNDEIEILEEEKKIPEKLEEFDIQGLEVSGYSMTQAEYLLEDGVKENRKIINWILDYLKSKGE